MHTFENKNMWVTSEQAMDSKDLILNATSQKNEIKVGMRIVVKNIREGLSSRNERVLPLLCSFVTPLTIVASLLHMSLLQLAQSKHSN
jgi:hypothetical protein